MLHPKCGRRCGHRRDDVGRWRPRRNACEAATRGAKMSSWGRACQRRGSARAGRRRWRPRRRLPASGPQGRVPKPWRVCPLSGSGGRWAVKRPPRGGRGRHWAGRLGLGTPGCGRRTGGGRHHTAGTQQRCQRHLRGRPSRVFGHGNGDRRNSTYRAKKKKKNHEKRHAACTHTRTSTLHPRPPLQMGNGRQARAAAT